ncbi:MAG: helical backbone metal receptor [Burkholderiales bacterium]|nr:helical backbone metal receptor [Burkholderiales bacterium]
MRKVLCGLAALASVAAASTSTASTSTASLDIVDDRGRTVRLAAPARRIISLLPSLTEATCALGACDRLVGIDRFSNWPPQVERLPRLGGLEDAQVERIVSLKPDLVLAASSARVIDRLEALRIPVLALEPKTLADTRRVLGAIAVAIGDPGAADLQWRAISARIDAAAARVPPSMRGQRVYFEVSSAPHAAGEGSFVGDVLARLGMGNIVPASMGVFPRLNPEYVVRAQPQVILGSDAGLRDMPKRPGWPGLAALRDRRTCAFPPAAYDILVRAGPRLGEAADLLVDCFSTLAKDGR